MEDFEGILQVISNNRVFICQIQNTKYLDNIPVVEILLKQIFKFSPLFLYMLNIETILLF